MKKRWIGFLIIISGLILLAENLIGSKKSAEGLSIGALFLIAYLFTGRKKSRGWVGLLIPGVLLFYLGSWEILQRYFDFNRLEASLNLLVISFSFLTIHFLHYQGIRKKSWAKMVGLILAVISGIILIFDYLQYIVPNRFFVNLFPLSLIVVGVVLFFKNYKSKKEEPHQMLKPEPEKSPLPIERNEIPYSQEEGELVEKKED